MQKQATQHTLDIFERVYTYVRPFVPKVLQEEIRIVLDCHRNDSQLTLEGLEDSLIMIGKKVWPYRRAFQEFRDRYHNQFGERFLLAQLSRGLKKKYDTYVVHGGRTDHVHSGQAAHFFSDDERVELYNALILVNEDIRQHVIQAIHSVDAGMYQGRVEEFHSTLALLETQMRVLHDLKSGNHVHGQVKEEIHAHIRGLEHGFGFLGPVVTEHDVRRAVEHFAGRVLDAKHFV
jgi:hypothetical protein